MFAKMLGSLKSMIMSAERTGCKRRQVRCLRCVRRGRWPHLQQPAHSSHPPGSQVRTAHTTASSRAAQPPPAPAFNTDDKRAGATRGPDPVHFRTGNTCERCLDYIE